MEVCPPPPRWIQHLRWDVPPKEALEASERGCFSTLGKNPERPEPTEQPGELPARTRKISSLRRSGVSNLLSTRFGCQGPERVVWMSDGLGFEGIVSSTLLSSLGGALTIRTSESRVQRPFCPQDLSILQAAKALKTHKAQWGLSSPKILLRPGVGLKVER